MFYSEKTIFLQETEIKPNHYARLVLFFLLFGMIFCLGMNEVGFFRVGTLEMRVGSLVPIFFVSVMLAVLCFDKKAMEKPQTKYWIFTVCSLLTLCINTLLNFHTTMMLLFPIFIAMLYRSKRLGIYAVIASTVCTVASPILGYLIGAWDIPLFEELILIGTNTVVSRGGDGGQTVLLAIGKIVLYLVLPRMIMVGSCAMLMFHVIRLGVSHVENQILLDKINRHDMLTGLFNQNTFTQILESDETGKVGILFFDVNGLKKANDTYGHEYGDELLRRCAKSLRDICDEKTNGFRIGGDEFLLLVEGADEDVMAKKYTEWVQALERINAEPHEGFPNLYCSMACGSVVGDFTDIKSLIHDADSIMYRNKAQMKQI